MSELLPKLNRFSTFYGVGGVDRERNIIRGVSLGMKGPALGHGVVFDDTTIDQVVDLSVSHNSGVKSRFTHPGLSSDGMGSFLGRVKNVHRDDQKAIGDLHLSEMAFTSPRGDLGNYVMGLASSDPGAFGMSLVTVNQKTVWRMEDGSEILHYDYESGERGQKDRPEGAVYEWPSVRFSAVRAVDIVDEPAANADGLFSDHLRGTNLDAESLFEELDLLLSRFSVSYERAYQFALDYFEARGVGKKHAAFDAQKEREIKALKDYLLIFR